MPKPSVCQGNDTDMGYFPSMIIVHNPINFVFPLLFIHHPARLRSECRTLVHFHQAKEVLSGRRQLQVAVPPEILHGKTASWRRRATGGGVFSPRLLLCH